MFFIFSLYLILKVNMLYSYAPITGPYIFANATSSEKLGARFI